MESVINRINDLLNKRGVKQKSLAAVLGITQAGVSKIFTGKNSLSVEYFYKMCIFLEISADWILQLDKESEEINIPKDPMFYFKSNVNHLTGNGNISQKVEAEKGELKAEINISSGKTDNEYGERHKNKAKLNQFTFRTKVNAK